MEKTALSFYIPFKWKPAAMKYPWKQTTCRHPNIFTLSIVTIHSLPVDTIHSLPVVTNYSLPAVRSQSLSIVTSHNLPVVLVSTYSH